MITKFTILFDSGSAVVSDKYKNELTRFINDSTINNVKSFLIIGHTDEDPIVYSKWVSNEELSLKRASEVMGIVRHINNSYSPIIVGLADLELKGSKMDSRRVVVYAFS